MMGLIFKTHLLSVLLFYFIIIFSFTQCQSSKCSLSHIYSIHIWPEKDSHKQIETIKYNKCVFEGERKPDERLCKKIYMYKCVSRISLVRPRNLKVKMNNNSNNIKFVKTEIMWKIWFRDTYRKKKLSKLWKCIWGIFYNNFFHIL